MSEEITWTKEYKLERYHKLNLTAEKGCVLFAGSSLMEMFPVEKFAHEDGLPVTVYNRGVSAEVIGLPDYSVGDALYRAKITISTPEVFAWTLVIVLLSATLSTLAAWALRRAKRALCREVEG